MKNLFSIFLFFIFSASFSYETVEYFVFGNKEVTEVVSIPELEDDSSESEDSKEEKDEKKIDDDYLVLSTLKDFYSIMFCTIIFSNKHFLPSHSSSKFSPPPEFI